MTTVKTKDGADIFYKDWGPRDGKPIVFHHGWPLSADDWDAQMLFLARNVLSEAVRQNWWRQAMMGAANAQFLCIKALSETDFTGDLRAIDIPVLILHGEDDQIVPVANGRATAELLKRSTLKTFPKLPHGMATTNADLVNSEILAFVQS